MAASCSSSSGANDEGSNESIALVVQGNVVRCQQTMRVLQLMHVTCINSMARVVMYANGSTNCSGVRLSSIGSGGKQKELIRGTRTGTPREC